LRIYAKLDTDNIGEVKFQNSITIIQCEIITEVQYNEIINDLKSFSESLSADDENLFMNMISDCYLALVVNKIITKNK
jgi:hypothetical protein